MNRKWLVIPLSALALAAGTAAALPKDAPADQDRPLARLIASRIGRAMAISAELDLTPDQKQAIAATLKSHKSDIASALRPVVAKARALRDATGDPDAGEAKIRSLADDLGKALGDAAVAGSKLRQELKQAANLTDEQARKLADFRADREAAIDRFLSKLASSEQ